jgi:diguanylate cyclase (GGDEF)-like protein/PAS domain S-box-containing protein
MRFRAHTLALPAALLLATALLTALALGEARASARHAGAARAAQAAALAAGRLSADVTALEGVRSAFGSSAAITGTAFRRHAAVALQRPELVSVGFAPHVFGGAGASAAPSTYPLTLAMPVRPGGAHPDLGADRTVGPALRLARTLGEPQLSAPLRLADGRLGAAVLVPVFKPGLPLATPGQRRAATSGFVTGSLDLGALAREVAAGFGSPLALRYSDAALAVSRRGVHADSWHSVEAGGRTFLVGVGREPASPLLPLTVLATGLALLGGLLLFRHRGHRLRELTAEFSARKARAQLELRDERDRLVARERRLQKASRAAESAFETLVSASGALVLQLDADGIVRYCSPESDRLLGFAPHELVGRTAFELVHPADLLSSEGAGEGTAVRGRYARSDGGWAWLETSRRTQRDELGRVECVTTVSRPVSAGGGEAAVQRRLQAALARECDPVELFAVVAEEAVALLGVRSATLVRFEATGFGTVVAAWAGGDTAPAPPGTPLPLESGTAAGLVFLTGAGSRSATEAAAPVRAAGRLWGALVVGGHPAGEALEGFSSSAAPIVVFADMEIRLAALASRDPLTNLADARAFHEQLRAEVRRAQRHGRSLALVVCNLDGFRALNQAHGRLAADRVLAEAARRLAGQTRQGEVVSRLGGDQFAWILPETEGIDGWIAADRARRTIAETTFAVGDVTASVGVCDLNDAESADELYAFADIALLHAKANGRNVTFRFSPELREQAPAPAPDEGRLGTLRALARAIDAEDPGLEGHSERVARLAEKLALASGWPAEAAIRLGQAALVHDVGKLSVPDGVLGKPGELSPEELEQVRRHPAAGAELAASALDEEQRDWVRHHHERWDGGGYPDGLVGEFVPAGARLLGLAEAWDTMTSNRSYGQALALAEALAECRRGSGTQFAPDAVAALERLWTLGALSPVETVEAEAGDKRG